LDGTWSAYDITVDGVSIGLEQNPTFPDGSDDTSRTFVVRWWKTGPDVERTVTVERVLECESETTTTLPEETTTTIPEETTTTPETTTVPEGTTTTVTGTSTTTGLVGSFWSASSECQTLTAEWGDGTTQVNVWQRLPEGDFDVTPFTESGQVLDASGALADSEWILVPVVITGYVAVPEEIHLFTEHCSPGPSTTVGPTTTDPDTSTLPFTGVGRMTWMTLVFAAGVSTVLGWVFVMGSREDA
jgi:hypothetical protein